MPIVSRETYHIALQEINKVNTVSLDLETTSLYPFRGGEVFSCIISTEDEDYYFNFNDQPDHNGNVAPDYLTLPISSLETICSFIQNSTVYIQNANFDQKYLSKYFINLYSNGNTVVCTQALARLLNNCLSSYSLDNLGALIGVPKDTTVKKYIDTHKLYTLVDTGKKTPRKDKHYDLVPFDIITKYGMQDGKSCLALGKYITKRIKEMDAEQVEQGMEGMNYLAKKEIAVTKALLKMETRGVLIDKVYTKEAYEHSKSIYLEEEAKFEALTGMEFEDSRKVLKAAFEKMNMSYGTTAKGNASFKDAILPDNTLGNIIRSHRKHYKLANTYYRNLLEMVGEDGAIHCSFKQSGTKTGRFSCIEPNLQNVPKRNEDDNKYPVRGCFIPRKDHVFIMIDYDQMEYRLLLDIAGEQTVIDKIIQDGLDVHTATAQEMDVERFAAKTLNFMLLYGGGAEKLAKALKITVVEAKKKKAKYFSTLKKVKNLVTSLIKISKERGWVVNPSGRRLRLVNKELAYQIPNHYIQGGCGDIVKEALVNLDNFLTSKNLTSCMLLQIHDELLFEVHKDELHIIKSLAKIMETAYKPFKLPLTVGVDIGTENWHNKEPYVE